MNIEQLIQGLTYDDFGRIGVEDVVCLLTALRSSQADNQRLRQRNNHHALNAAGVAGGNLSGYTMAEVEAEIAERDAARAHLAAAEVRASTAEAANTELRTLVELFCSKYPTTQEFWVRKFRAALVVGDEAERCSTCDGVGHVYIEPVIGAPGSGGHITCPDCGPRPSEHVEVVGDGGEVT